MPAKPYSEWSSERKAKHLASMRALRARKVLDPAYRSKLNIQKAASAAERHRRNPEKRREYSRQYYARNSARLKRYVANWVRNWRHTPENWVKHRVRTIRWHATKAGIPFDLTPADLVMPAACPVFGTPFVFEGNSFQNPSVDRLIPSKGYTKGNVAIISKRANTIKSDASLEELEQVAAWLRGRLS